MTNPKKSVHQELYLKKEKLKREKANLEDKLSFSWILSDKEEINLRRELGRVDEKIRRQEALSRQVL